MRQLLEAKRLAENVAETPRFSSVILSFFRTATDLRIFDSYIRTFFLLYDSLLSRPRLGRLERIVCGEQRCLDRCFPPANMHKVHMLLMGSPEEPLTLAGLKSSERGRRAVSARSCQTCRQVRKKSY